MLKDLLKKLRRTPSNKDQNIDQYRKVTIPSLVELMKDTEPTAVEYHGPSKEFLDFVASNNLPCEIGEITTHGSVAKLARKELEFLFRKHDATLDERYWAGRALGYTPKEILSYHKFPLELPYEFSQTHRSISRELTDKRSHVSLSPSHLRKAGVDIVFNSAYSGASPYQGYKLILELTEKGYATRELTLS
ncbi:Uncharacterised protein [uncultured archaeon]|nr:Uncharacterised protein [uncultured archaeon]